MDVLAVSSLGATLASWQVQLDWGLRILASLVAITAGVLSLWGRYHAHRVKKRKPLD